jgi:YrbI family 3-deoxy-D-manno-octulosonate 8-phosphate phosphatase
MDYELDKLLSKLKKIKLVITDVDGVLTDGGLYYTEDGMVMKRFNVKDGMGTLLLREKKILCGIISTDKSSIITKRAERLKLDFVYTEIWDKKSQMLELCKQYEISSDNVAFIGDDVNDLDIIKSVGFSACPRDAVDKVAEIVDFVCTKNGGQGAFREFVDLILSTHKQ